jgi:hypothetical protein
LHLDGAALNGDGLELPQLSLSNAPTTTDRKDAKREVRRSNMDFGGLVDLIKMVLAIGACATLLFSVVGAAFGVRHGAQQGDTRGFKLVAMLCGCLGGVVVAVIVGSTLLAFGLPAGLVVGPLFGCATSYGIAWAA